MWPNLMVKFYESLNGFLITQFGQANGAYLEKFTAMRDLTFIPPKHLFGDLAQDERFTKP